jgi:hypothetical protein
MSALREAAPSPALRIYPALLGPGWTELHANLQRFFGGYGAWHGPFDVRRGRGLFARLVAALFRLPRPGTRIATTLEVTPAPEGERWERRFGDRNMVTLQRATPDGLVAERMGCVEILLRASSVGREIHFEQVAARFVWGPLRLSLPRWVAPQVTATTGLDASGAIAVRVRISAMRATLLVGYEGSIRGGQHPPLVRIGEEP